MISSDNLITLALILIVLLNVTCTIEFFRLIGTARKKKDEALALLDRAKKNLDNVQGQMAEAQFWYDEAKAYYEKTTGKKL